jgi:hypothetical protein
MFERKLVVLGRPIAMPLAFCLILVKLMYYIILISQPRGALAATHSDSTWICPCGWPIGLGKLTRRAP